MTSSNASLAASGVSGFYQGMQDKRDRETYDRQKELADMQLSQAKGAMKQGEFTQAARQAVGQYVATNGNNYQAIPDLYNKHFPDGGRMDVQRDANGSYLVNMTKPDGTVIKGQKPLNFDEFGQIGAALTNPEHYMEARQKSADLREKYKAEYELAAKKARLPGGSGSAQLDMIDRIQAEYKVDWPTAFEIFKTSSSDPQKAAAAMYMQSITNRDKNMDRGDKNWLTDDEIWKGAVDSVQRMQKQDLSGISDRYRKSSVDTRGMTAPQIAPPSALFMNGQGNGVGPITTPEQAMPGAPPAASGITAPGSPRPVAAPPQTALPSPVTADQPDTAAIGRLSALLQTRQGKPTKLNNGQVWALDSRGTPVRRTDLEQTQ